MTSDRNIQDLCPEMQTLCLQWLDQCKEAGLNVIITQTYRSKAEQNIDYEQGRSIAGPIITNAQGGNSPHNCTLPNGLPGAKAFDFAIIGDSGALDWNPQDALWQKAIAIGKGLGLVSGGDWHSLKDYPHFELPNWQAGIL